MASGDSGAPRTNRTDSALDEFVRRIGRVSNQLDELISVLPQKRSAPESDSKNSAEDRVIKEQPVNPLRNWRWE
jgi:hypothetical protein